ncbi:hypothetical protein V6N11_070774 [Hibiscus sabdariffa]|uniref:Uncharacterized protein n=1 Tax=Hibiscus sabdariffa TaxID=183260 RepID=A0ABR2QGF2_9ROSI
MGKEIVLQESKRPSKLSRLWRFKDVYKVLKYNKGTESTKGIKLDMFQIDKLRLCPTIFENMLNLRYINFCFSPFTGKYRNRKLHADQVDGVSLPDELRLMCWEHYPFRSLSNFNPKNLVVLKLSHGDMEQLWNDDYHQGLVNLRKVVLSDCKKLKKIPNLFSATNLEILCFNGCKSLVDFPCFTHLTSLKTLQLHGCCNLKKFPELPKDLSVLNLTETGIEEVPDSVQRLVGLEMLCLSNSSIKNVSTNISKLESLRFLDLSHCLIAEFPEIPRLLVDNVPYQMYIGAVPQSYRPLPEAAPQRLMSYELKASSSQKIPSNITFSGGSRRLPVADLPSSNLRFKSLGCLKMNHCKSLKLLPELPPYLRYLNAHGCTSLEEVSFTYQNRDLYEPHSFDGEDEFLMIFSNCSSLNRGSIYNIEENAMLKVISLAKKCACGPKKVVCCIPGNKIEAIKFPYQSMNASLILQITPNTLNWYSRRRFFVFAICLIADLSHCHIYGDLEFICEYQLIVRGDGYEKFRSEWCYKLDYVSEPEYMGDHKLILFSGDMVKEDKDYELASFQFYIKNRYYGGEENDIKVKKCGVHVSYVDEEGDAVFMPLVVS